MTQSNDVKPRSRMVSLDVLRGLAILMVLVVHAPWPDWFLQGFGGRLVRVGSHGVDLFFVLSGFLISRLLFGEIQQTGSINVVRFWLRRGFKIWPSYYVAYLSAVVLSSRWAAHSQVGSEIAATYAWSNFVFLQNYVHPESRWFASWSLAIEEHFYTVLPLLLLLLLRLRILTKSIVPILVTTCLLVPWLRFFNGDEAAIYIQTHLRMDALCFGVLLGHWQFTHVGWPFQFVSRYKIVAVVLTLISLAIPALLPFEHWLTHTMGLTLLAFCSSFWTAHAVAVPDCSADRGFLLRQAIWLLSGIGVYSYTIYLVQLLVIILIGISKQLATTSWFMNSHGPQILAFWFGCLGLGWLLSTVVERPCLLIRERFVPK